MFAGIGAKLASFFLNWLWAKIAAGIAAAWAAYQANQMIKARAQAAGDALQKAQNEKEREDAAHDSLGDL